MRNVGFLRKIISVILAIMLLTYKGILHLVFATPCHIIMKCMKIGVKNISYHYGHMIVQKLHLEEVLHGVQ